MDYVQYSGPGCKGPMTYVELWRDGRDNMSTRYRKFIYTS